MGFTEVVAKVRGEGGAGAKKVPMVVMTNGKKFVFNSRALNLIGEIAGMKAAVLFDEEAKSIGFRFNKSASNPTIVGTKTITVKANISHILPDELKTGKWQATVEWNKEAQVFEAKFAEAEAGRKRGEAKAIKMAAMAPEKLEEYLRKEEDRRAKEKAKRAAAKAAKAQE